MNLESLYLTVLWPIRWLVELVMVAWHWIFSNIGMDPNSGLTWVLSIVGLVVVVRAALIPVFVRQIKNQRKMLEVAPQIKKIQDKYKGKRDQLSREAMSREMMAFYKESGTNPLSSCIPLLIQIPIFGGLFAVLNNASQGHNGIGAMNETLSRSFGQASLFGFAPLHDSFQSAMNHAGGPVVPVMIVAAIMVALMVASQFYTQLQIMSKNISDETKNSPQFRQQRTLMYFLPFIFLFSGFAFPLGVMFYWLTTNIWTMVQQFLVIRSMPTPGSEAARAREERLAKRRDAMIAAGKLQVAEPAVEGGEAVVTRVNTQRQQPVSNRRKKKRR
ncbi:membrane protein insertase YidC [Gryllotalpicola protaetiae]|uniref:Membrane protein insertase YidC n=1 Tax=Gryllotalpicola protaetiae TaxID=2419771 RepID=A0A387BMC4_9MICO|nr:membrane protein insertase YidC [Gryllotalpicola protaetiae]AYG03542.1 membrane protein insertase YidC [Gryllotalpicola protaetiae]